MPRLRRWTEAASLKTGRAEPGTASRAPSLLGDARARRSRVHVREEGNLEEARRELASERRDRQDVQRSPRLVGRHAAGVVIAAWARRSATDGADGPAGAVVGAA